MARYLRLARPLALAAISVAATCLAVDVLLLSGGPNAPFAQPFASEPGNETVVGMRIAAVGDGLVVRVPRPLFASGGSYVSNGTCILAQPEGTLYALKPADTARLLAGEAPLAPLLSEPAASARQSYCSRDHGLPEFVEVRFDGEVDASLDWLPYDPARPRARMPAWGVDFVFVYPTDATPPAPGAWTSGNLSGTPHDAAEDWAAATHREGGLLEASQVRADKALRLGAAIGLAVFVASAPALFLRPPAPPASPTEAALRLRDAGERHLLRLRTAWLQIGGLLLASLVFSFAWAVQSALTLNAGARPVEHWHFWVIGGILAVAACLVAAWVAGLRQRQRELRAWRQAFADRPVDSLDDL